MVCWEHKAIHEIANSITRIVAGAQIPQAWSDTRFDLVWAFTFNSRASHYTFTQIPQMLLDGDVNESIAG